MSQIFGNPRSEDEDRLRHDFVEADGLSRHERFRAANIVVRFSGDPPVQRLSPEDYAKAFVELGPPAPGTPFIYLEAGEGWGAELDVVAEVLEAWPVAIGAWQVRAKDEDLATFIWHREGAWRRVPELRAERTFAGCYMYPIKEALDAPGLSCSGS